MMVLIAIVCIVLVVAVASIIKCYLLRKYSPIHPAKPEHDKTPAEENHKPIQNQNKHDVHHH